MCMFVGGQVFLLAHTREYLLPAVGQVSYGRVFFFGKLFL